MSIQQMFLGFPPPSSGGGVAIETNGLIAYWDAIPANVSGEYVSDTSGNGQGRVVYAHATDTLKLFSRLLVTGGDDA